jgi:hypothetical protein
MVLHSACRYCTRRLSTLPTIRTALYGNSTTDYFLCSALLCQAILQPTIRSALLVDIAIGDYIRSTDNLLCSAYIDTTTDYPP